MARIALALTLALASTATAAAADCPPQPQGSRLDRNHGAYEHATCAPPPNSPSAPALFFADTPRCVCVCVCWPQGYHVAAVLPAVLVHAALRGVDQRQGAQCGGNLHIFRDERIRRHHTVQKCRLEQIDSQ